MKRKAWLLLIVLCLFFPAATSEAAGPEVRLVRMLESEGAVVEQVVLHHGSRAPVPLSSGEAARLAQRLAKAFGLSGLNVRAGDDGVAFSADHAVSSGIRAGVTVVHDGRPNSKIRPYVSVRLAAGGRPGPKLQRLRAESAGILQSFGIIPQFHVTVQGSKPARTADLRQAVDRLLEKAGAREVESMRTGHTVSVSAYASVFPDRLDTAGGTMNLQIAARLNYHANRLILTMGTPIITIEY